MKNILFYLLFIALLLMIPLHGISQQLLININTAEKKELKKLRGIGEKRAQKIIKSREQVGLYQNKNELVERNVLSQNTFKKIQRHIIIKNPITNVEKITLQTSTNDTQNNIELLLDGHFFQRVQSLLLNAKDSVYITTFIFKTSNNKNNYAVKLLKTIKQIATQGVQIHLVLENSNYNDSLTQDNRATANRLKQSFINIRFDSPNKIMHSKLIVIDGRYSIIGSHNLTHSALKKNKELSILIDSKAIAQNLIKYIQTIQ